jgi:hypothetical protein
MQRTPVGRVADRDPGRHDHHQQAEHPQQDVHLSELGRNHDRGQPRDRRQADDRPGATQRCSWGSSLGSTDIYQYRVPVHC